MKPVMQTVTAPGKGNCFPACIASILEVDLSEVPYVNQEGWEGAECPIQATNRWLKPKNLALLPIAPSHFEGAFSDAYYIMSARSPRFDGNHAVVCKNGEIVHDPHPEAHLGVGEPTRFYVFIALHPARN